jgi:transposase
MKTGVLVDHSARAQGCVPFAPFDSAPMTAPAKPSPRGGVIELEMSDVQLRLRGLVDEATLCSVLRALRQTQ